MLPVVTRAALAAGCIAVLASGLAPARAGEPSGEDTARALAEEVLRRAGSGGDDGLGAWSRSVIDRALERAGGAIPEPDASPAPLPAERHAAGFAGGRPNSAEVIVFMSLSVPAMSWHEWAREAARIGASEHAGPPLVLRGVAGGSLRATAAEIGERLGGHDAGVAIDPRLFRLFRVERVPAVVVVPGGVPACASPGCADDPAPPHDLVTGNIGLGAALEAVAAEGDAGRATARAALARLEGDLR